MPGYKVPNLYYGGGGSDPLTAGANSINNIAWAMMRSMKTPEELEAIRQQAALRGEQINQAKAVAAEHNAKVRYMAYDRQREEEAIPEYLMSVAGIDRPTLDKVIAANRMGFSTPGAWGYKQDAEGTSIPLTQADVISPAQMALINGARASLYGDLSSGAKTTADGRAKSVRNNMQGAWAAPVYANGKVPANVLDVAMADRALDSSQPIFSTNSAGIVTNNISGKIDESGGLAKAHIRHENAGAANQSAHAGLANAQTDTEKMTVDWINPETGTSVKLPIRIGVPALSGEYRADVSADSRTDAANIRADGAAGKGKSQDQIKQENAIRKELGFRPGESISGNMLVQIGAVEDKAWSPTSDPTFSERIVSEAAAIKLANPSIDGVSAARLAVKKLKPLLKNSGLMGGDVRIDEPSIPAVTSASASIPGTGWSQVRPQGGPQMGRPDPTKKGPTVSNW